MEMSRYSLAMAIAGTMTVVLASLLVWLVVTEAGLSVQQATANVTAAGGANAYFAVRLAISTALIVTASPHMSEPIRRIGAWVLWIGALASIALGTATATGALAGALIGVGAAAAIHLVLGSPNGRLTSAQVASALADIGVDAVDLDVASLGARGVATLLPFVSVLAAIPAWALSTQMPDEQVCLRP